MHPQQSLRVMSSPGSGTSLTGKSLTFMNIFFFYRECRPQAPTPTASCCRQARERARRLRCCRKCECRAGASSPLGYESFSHAIILGHFTGDMQHSGHSTGERLPHHLVSGFFPRITASRNEVLAPPRLILAGATSDSPPRSAI